MIRTKEALLEEAIHEIKAANEYIAKFAADLVKSPSYSFSWSSDAFKYAAKHKVWSCVESFCVNLTGSTMESIRDEVRSIVLRGAMYPELSSSSQSNLMSQETLAAWATVLEQLPK